MPIYEYRCEGCGRKVTIFVRRMGADEGVACPRCGSQKLERLFSRFAMARSEEARLERLADPSALGDVDENDPKSMARFMKRMGKELGEEAGPEFDQAVEELEAGGGLDEGPDGGGDDSASDAAAI
ncbi:MAG: zinc ribbon domain-containing protein [Bryobacteraceae bacterium]|nr:zinc ribbon domain-containing protein [Bryobacteraceae bacterium]